MAGGELFKSTYAFNDRIGGCERVQIIACACGRNAMVKDEVARGSGFTAAAAQFRRLGWRVAGKRRDDTCPDCIAGRPVPVLKPKGPKMTTTKAAGQPGVALGVSAAPPRQPTFEDWRRIREVLDVDYDDVAGRYREALNDRIVSERLLVPRAWVTEERERAYGPERCEADTRDLDDLKQIVAMAGELSAKHLELAASAENLGKNAQRLADKLAARGVA
jgi:hypothetical protein